MFAGQKYQERIKNRISTPDITAVAVVTLFDFIALMIVMQIASNTGLLSWPAVQSPRLIVYPVFFAIYFANWRLWTRVKRHGNELGMMARQLADTLPVGSFFAVLGVAVMLLFVLTWLR